METNNIVPIVDVNSIATYNKLNDLETYHPLVQVVDFREHTIPAGHFRYRYGLYCLWLKHGLQCSIKYGRKTYDYQCGTIVNYGPGQMIEIDNKEPIPNADVQGILFHPDLIYGTPLARHIGEYHFFDYDSAEALHLSTPEQNMFVNTLESIKYEIEQPIDNHSQTIIVDRIKLILDYCQRFYERQFITRHKVNSDVLTKFDNDLNEYFKGGNAARNGLPSVAYFADKACLSPGYFGDLIKKETGLNAQRFIQQKIISLSKAMIMDDQYALNQIARHLGFQYQQHFSRFFKRIVGVTPKEYREK